MAVPDGGLSAGDGCDVCSRVSCGQAPVAATRTFYGPRWPSAAMASPARRLKVSGPDDADELPTSSRRATRANGSRRSAGWRAFFVAAVAARRADHRAAVRACVPARRAALVARARGRLRARVLGVRLRPLRSPAAAAAAMTRLPVTVTVNGEAVRRRRRAAHAARALPSRSSRADRHARRLRRRRVRRLLGAGRRRAREVVPDAGGAGPRTRGDDDRGAGAATATLHPVQEAFVNGLRAAVRLLHAGIRDGQRTRCSSAIRTPPKRRSARTCRAISACAPATSRSSRR